MKYNQMDVLKKLNLISLSVFIVFTLLLLFFLFNDIRDIKSKNRSLALNHVKNSFDKNVMFRQWVAMHGGVYVTPTEKTPPNPYLKYINNRDITTTTGNKLTLMNPAYVLKEFFSNFKGFNGETGHLTSLNALNPDNKPDLWEEKVLKAFENKEFNEYYEFVHYENKKHLRYIKALTVKESCLKCHVQQGYKVGDIRGAITINLPTKFYDSIEMTEYNNILKTYLLLWLVGMLIFVVIYLKFKKSRLTQIKTTKELNAKEAILQQQSKMAAMGEMIDNIAHQWRQPLSIITTFSSGMKIKKELGQLDDKEVLRIADNITDQANHLSKTIDDFRDFFKKDKKPTTILSLDCIERVLRILDSKIKNRDIDIIKSIDFGSIKVIENELIQVLMNLISNAIDALENRKKNRVIKLDLIIKKKFMTIKIHDNAGGIDEAIIQKVFDAYFTTKAKDKGSGIGLYMSKEIITKNLKGQITVSNETIEYNNETYLGAQFKIRLPIV